MDSSLFVTAVDTERARKAAGVPTATPYTSAGALFFASLIPLSIKHSSAILLPLTYGIGTALPVFAFAVLIAVGANSLAKVFQKVSRFELWARRITGIIFLLIGIYFTLVYTIAIKGLLGSS